MGTWGTGAFENDCASDWVAQLSGYNDSTPIVETLGDFLELTAEARDAEACCTVIAAAAIVAAQYHRKICLHTNVKSYDESGTALDTSDETPSPDIPLLPQEAAEYLTRVQAFPKNLQAAATLSVIVIRDESELRELWTDSTEDLQLWTESLDEILQWLPRAADYKITEAKKWVSPKVTLASGFQPKFKSLEKDTEQFLKQCQPIARNEYESYGMKAYDDALSMLFDVYWQNKIWQPLVTYIKSQFDYRFGHNRLFESLSAQLLNAGEFEHLFVIWEKALKQQAAHYRALRRDKKKWPDSVHEESILLARGYLTVTLANLISISRIADDPKRMDDYEAIYERVDSGKNP